VRRHWLRYSFQVDARGRPDRSVQFCSQAACADGAYPGGLVLSSNGNFYGITDSGGTGKYCTIRSSSTAGCGTVFSITPAGELTTLYSFCSQANCSDGYVGGFVAGLIQATNGNFYGTTYGAGANGYGTVFEITPTGELTTLYSFCSETNCADGAYPFAALVQGSDGNFYGTTNGGGGGNHCTITGGCGTVFIITPAGVLTTLYSFCNVQNCSDGATPYSALAQGTDGNFYGTTYGGGANSSCPGNCGAIFKLTPAGTLTTLYSFCSQTGCSDGFGPWAGLSLGNDSSFYGTTGYGGNTANGATNGSGTIFKVTPAGALTALHIFDNTDGSVPLAQLVQATNGTFYGTTVYGGDLSCGSPNGCGTVFNLSVGLGPFVETNPTSGPVGQPVTILGTSLTGTTTVKFNGTAATFTVVSGSEITTTVPGGATTGTVEVTTPSGTLNSNAAFNVTSFQLSNNPTALTIVAGQSGTVTLTVTPGNGFNSSVSFACSGLPAEATCAFNPTSVTPNGGAITSTLTITTTAPSTAMREPIAPAHRPIYALLFPGLTVVFVITARRKRTLRDVQIFGLLITLLVASGLTSCGGGTGGSPGGGNSGTPVGTSTVSVTASTSGSGAIGQMATVTVTITE
jgi:uncharacterized repeat protein (TIGR03803 family)